MINAKFKHPFTSIIDGPSQSGKSTFIRNLFLRLEDFVDVPFDYIYIFMGTSAKANPTLCEIKSAHPRQTTIFEVPTLFKDFQKEFPPYFFELLEREKGRHGCIIVDDLMQEFSKCTILMDLFTKISAHNRVSVIYVTQNLFARTLRNTNVTLYRNTHVLVHFRSSLDMTPTNIIASRLGGGDHKSLMKMFKSITNDHRYVIIRGDTQTDPEMMFTSDIFSRVPGTNIPLMRAFSPKV